MLFLQQLYWSPPNRQIVMVSNFIITQVGASVSDDLVLSPHLISFYYVQRLPNVDDKVLVGLQEAELLIDSQCTGNMKHIN
jgi:hypothetical protein